MVGGEVLDGAELGHGGDSPETSANLVAGLGSRR
jgi:hypothetical protein